MLPETWKKERVTIHNDKGPLGLAVMYAITEIDSEALCVRMEGELYSLWTLVDLARMAGLVEPVVQAMQLLNLMPTTMESIDRLEAGLLAARGLVKDWRAEHPAAVMN